MFRSLRSIRHAFLGLVLVLAALQPLQAQLDTKLQSSKTDFMDMYQQSTSLKAKPEIVTIFDYSRSMASLMFHPLYRNNDTSDSDDSTRYMKFVLYQSTSNTTAVVPSTNKYTIKATPYCNGKSSSGAAVTYVVSYDGTSWVGANGPAPKPGCPDTGGTYHPAVTTDTAITITAKADGNTGAYASVTFTPPAGKDPVFTLSGNKSVAKTGYTFTHSNGMTSPTPIIELSSNSGSNGQTITMTVYLTHPFIEGENVANKGITWSASGGLTSTGNPSATGSFSTPAWTEVSSGLYKSVITWTIPGFTPTDAYTDPVITGDPVLLQPITMSGTPGSGSVLTFNTYFQTIGKSTNANYNKIAWTVSGDSGVLCAFSKTITGTPTTATTSSGGSVTWTVPAVCTQTTGGVTTSTDPWVYVSLDPQYLALPGQNPVPGITYLTSVLTAGTSTSNCPLIKPNGQPVTKADANAAAGSLYGTSQGQEDIRNWIRAASHVRFTYGTRTLDIPIPWKITDVNSTSNPLTSVTVPDTKTVLTYDSNNKPVTTTYGSGNPIELDMSYQVEGTTSSFNGSVFTEDTNSPGTWCRNSTTKANAETTVYLYSVLYRPAYISWLFNGTYQNTDATKPGYVNSATSSLIGKYIIFDAANAALVAGQGNVTWGQGYGPTGTWGNIQVPDYNSDGTYKDLWQDEASNYRIPALTRLQASKRAAIQTWINHQDQVIWAFRFLDPTNEATPTNLSTIDNNSNNWLTSGDPTTTHMNGNDSAWTVLNNTTTAATASVDGMKRIASMFAWGSTPLTYAVARTLAQFSDPKSALNAAVGTDVSQCINHYLLIFTDGVDNNNAEGYNNANSDTPYIIGDGTAGNAFRLSALNGNQKIIAAPTNIDRTGNNWNLFTFSGIAAHLSDATMGVLNTDYKPAPDPGTNYVTGKAPSYFLPYAIKKRNGIYFGKDHRITTMTVGVSLGGQSGDANSPKRSLFLAAAVGDPTVKIGDLSTFHTFNGWEPSVSQPNSSDNDWIADPQDPGSYPKTGVRKAGAVFFFDATSADKLTKSMEFAFRIAIQAGGNNATSSPNLPFVGASLGKQVYLGTFNPPSVGGSIWPGDLMMFGIREESGKVSIIDQNGNVTSTVDKSTAQWAASNALTDAAKSWKNRTLYTRWPLDNVATLRKFTDLNPDYDDSKGGGLQKYVGTSTASNLSANDRIAVVQFAMGGDTNLVTEPARPTSNRANIMGDVIDSAPAAIEYNFDDVKSAISQNSRLAAVNGNRFRLILVGTNQGWLHAFGEVTKTTSVKDNNGVAHDVIQGDVDELWAFMPTDFLANLDYIKNTSNSHRFMVDGTVNIYHLDLPPATGGSGNGVVDKTERAIAVFGLRKGGRSYYALDIHDPFSPAMQWSLVPDEAASFPNDSLVSGQTRIVTGGPDLKTVQGILQNWGFSSSTPAFGRVLFNGIPRDAVFLGGGFSVPEVEANFPTASKKPTPLGRSVMAVDVYTGAILAAQDMTDATISPNDSKTGQPTLGPVGAGVIPFEFILNSGMAQRAYFLDYKGGLWAWGSKDVSASSTFKNFRSDTSEITNWKIRKVYQDDNNSTSGYGGRYTTLPAPFKVGYFPGMGQTGTTSPAAVGIAMVSGDRNNPLDFHYGETDAYGNTTTAPDHHRVTVVFDRQDSRTWGLDTDTGPDTGITDKYLLNVGKADPVSPSNLATTSTYSLSPGTANYYLSPTDSKGLPDTSKTLFGYYINFPSMTNKFLAKGINPPIVVSGSLFYSEFIPSSADPCTGGTGKTWSWFVSDVLNPLVNDTTTGLSTNSGLTNKDNPWNGVASDYIPVGTRAVLQGGTVAVANPQAGASTTTQEIHTTNTSPAARYPKPRVWRTVH